MSERLKPVEPQEQENAEWRLLSEMPHRDYWVGADYNDMYHSRLQLNVPRFESICRQLDLPPVEITSIGYNPPAEEYPEMVGRGFAAWKKAAFGKPTSNNDPNAVFDVMDMPEKALLGIRLGEEEGAIAIPLGWRLGVRARKIERDIARIDHSLSKEETEQLFIDQFNDALWQGIKKIFSYEWTDVRALGLQPTSRKNMIPLAISSLAAPLTPGVIEYLSGINLSLPQYGGAVTGANAGYQLITTEAVNRWMEANADEAADPRLTNRLSMFVSNSWRSEEFPNRFAKETHGMNEWTERAIHGLPFVGIAMENNIKYGIVRKQQSQPLLRLA